MILARKKSDSRYAGVEFVITRMITDQIELYSVLLPLFIHQLATGRRYLESTHNPHPKSQKKNISVMEYFGTVV